MVQMNLSTETKTWRMECGHGAGCWGRDELGNGD